MEVSVAVDTVSSCRDPRPCFSMGALIFKCNKRISRNLHRAWFLGSGQVVDVLAVELRDRLLGTVARPSSSTAARLLRNAPGSMFQTMPSGTKAWACHPRPRITFITTARPASSSRVRIDSGWNWTAATGSSGCSTAITMPSSLSAVISSASGNVPRSA